MSAGREYGNCLIVVENNTVGFAVLEKLIENKYPNIYFSVKSTHEAIDQFEAEQRGGTGTVAGFSTTIKTRPLIVSKAEEYVRNKQLVIHSKRLIGEMQTFIWNNGRPEAMSGFNDDLIMALAIACWVRDVALNANAKDLEYRKAFLSSITKLSRKVDTTVVGQAGHITPTKEDTLKQAKAGKDIFWIYKG
jgi:hypothetical protein